MPAYHGGSLWPPHFTKWLNLGLANSQVRHYADLVRAGGRKSKFKCDLGVQDIAGLGHCAKPSLYYGFGGGAGLYSKGYQNQKR